MKKFFTTSLGRLRLLAIMEGITLLCMVFISVPLRLYFGLNTLSQIIGPIHGCLFLLFVFNTLQFGVTQRWKFKETTWKVLLACIVPFGTFYIDYTVLRKIETNEHPAQ